MTAYLVVLGEAKLIEKELRRLGEEMVAAYLDTMRFFHGFYHRYCPRGASGGGDRGRIWRRSRGSVSNSE